MQKLGWRMKANEVFKNSKENVLYESQEGTREGLHLQGTSVAFKEVGGVSRPLEARVTRVPAVLSQQSTLCSARLCGRMRRMPIGRLCLPVTCSALPREAGSFLVEKKQTTFTRLTRVLGMLAAECFQLVCCCSNWRSWLI